MMRIIEATVFLTLAAGVHIGLWTAAPQTTGASSSGGSGQARMTLAAAAPQHAALARKWQRPPDTADIADVPAPAPPETAAPLRPSDARSGPTLPPAPTLAPVLPAALPNVAAPPVRQPVAPIPDAPEQTKTSEPDRTLPQMPTTDAMPARPTATAPLMAQPDNTPVADTTPPAPPPQKTAKSESASAARPSGGGQARTKTTGQSGRDQTQSDNAAIRNALQAKWGARIQRKVHRRMIYPRGQTISGIARVALTIDQSGRLIGLRLIKSSGNAAIDKAALGAVKRAGRFPAAPAELTENSYSFTLALNYRP